MRKDYIEAEEQAKVWSFGFEIGRPQRLGSRLGGMDGRGGGWLEGVD
jgi:hypothetical protein